MSGFGRDFDGMGRPAIHMDYTDMRALFKRFPEMDPAVCDDPDIRAKGWNKWIKSSASEPYRLRTKI